MLAEQASLVQDLHDEEHNDEVDVAHVHRVNDEVQEPEEQVEADELHGVDNVEAEQVRDEL